MLETLSVAVIVAMPKSRAAGRCADALWQRTYVRCGNLDLAAVYAAVACTTEGCKKRVKLVAAKNKTSCH